MPEAQISKSVFKARALQLLREVERTGQGLVVTDRGRAVARIVPYDSDPSALLARLRGTLVRYEAPTEPVGAGEWESLA